MTRTELESLIAATLYVSFNNQRGSCFVVNEAGIRLSQASAEALPVVESVLAEIGREGAADGHDFRGRYPGLSYVVGAYAVVSAKFAPTRCVEFLQTLPNELLAFTIATLPAFFRQIDGRFNFGVAPPKELLEFVNGQAGSADDMIRAAALRAAGFLRYGQETT